MATFNIEDGSIRTEGGKTFMRVTFKASGNHSVTCPYEVESEDVVAIERTLQAAADEFEARPVVVDAPLALETGVDKQFVEPEQAI